MNIVNTDILEVTHGVIIHGCNCRGAFSSGLAGQIAKRYPDAKQAYLGHMRRLESFEDPSVLLGDIAPATVTPTLVIVNAFTQLDYGRDPNVQYVSPAHVQGAFEKLCDRMGRSFVDPVFKHLHYPRIGAGLGGGDWEMLHNLIQMVITRHPDLEFTFHDYTPQP